VLCRDRRLPLRSSYRIREPRHIPRFAVHPAARRRCHWRSGDNSRTASRCDLRLLPADRIQPVGAHPKLDPRSDHRDCEKRWSGGVLRGGFDPGHDLCAKRAGRCGPGSLRWAQAAAARGRRSRDWTSPHERVAFGLRSRGATSACRLTRRLFKYMSIKRGGISMGRIGRSLAAVAAFLFTVVACGGSSGVTPQTDVGVTSNSILLGTTNALSGPAAAYGTIANAENAYFTYVNNTQGGVNGRKITLKILDD